MRSYLRSAALLFLMGTALLGGIYPCVVSAFAHLFFPWQAKGCPVERDGKPVGLYYMGQRFFSERYVCSRPSWGYQAGDLFVSGGSNLSWSSPILRSSVCSRERQWSALLETEKVARDMIMASASGCDPELSLLGALSQAGRIAISRGVDKRRVREIILSCQQPCWGGLFPSRVNLLEVNLLLDQRCPIAG